MARLLILMPLLAVLRCAVPSNPQHTGEPLVVFTFDDGDQSIYDLAFPLMSERTPDGAATHFLPATYPNTPSRVTVQQLQEMERIGWETGGHGFTHENLSSVPLDTAERQIAQSDSFLQANGLSHESYAYAYGNYNAEVREAVAKRFANVRTAHDLKYLDGVDRLELGAFDAKSGQVADDLIGRIQEARQLGSPLVIFCFHYVVPDSVDPGLPHDWWTRESAFVGLLDYLREREMRPMSVRDAMGILCE
jgi:peptidoglycan/xylan/chitin deacetylase (PgdA/CDA1 family)